MVRIHTRRLPAPVCRAVPVLGVVSAGDPQEQSSHTLGFVEIPLPRRGPPVFGFVVRGQSMCEAGIRDGQVVLVQPRLRFEDGDVAVVAVGTRITLKRVFRDPVGYRLVPANGAYPPLYVTDAEAHWSGGADLFGHSHPQVRVLGIVVGQLSTSVFPVEPLHPDEGARP